VSLLHRREVMRKDSRVLLGLHELLTYGLKGVAAYAHHAEMLGKVDPQLDDVFEEVRGGTVCRSRMWLLQVVNGRFGVIAVIPTACRHAWSNVSFLHTLLCNLIEALRQAFVVGFFMSLSQT
jgi:hypothetical protein